MISELNKRKIKISLINARMSEKSFKRWFAIRYYGRKILEKFNYNFIVFKLISWLDKL